MKNEEAFKKAKEYLEEKTWIPSKFAFELPLRIVWMCTRITQAYYYSGHKYVPKTLKELEKYEQEMKKNESNNV